MLEDSIIPNEVPVHHVIAFILLFSIGCMVGEDAAMPVAPSQLTAEPAAGGGVHLTWADNSSDEMHFMVMRMMHDGPTAGQKSELATLDEDVAEYHDASTESGMTYMYMVSAMNDWGESDSNEVVFSAP